MTVTVYSDGQNSYWNFIDHMVESWLSRPIIIRSMTQPRGMTNLIDEGNLLLEKYNASIAWTGAGYELTFENNEFYMQFLLEWT